MSISDENAAEITKLKKYEKQYEGIVRTATNREQQQRAKVDLKGIKDRLKELDPKGEYLGVDDPDKPSLENTGTINTTQVLSRFPIEKASPSCADKDTNLMYTILLAWEQVFMTALFDQNVKLDYSLNAERDTHFPILANCKRFQKMFSETQEDWKAATRDDAKIQLAEMKRRYARQYLNDGANFLRKMKTFWSDIGEDIKIQGTKCMNRTDIIKSDPQFEQAEFMNGLSVANAVKISVQFLNESIRSLRLPEIPKMDPPR